MGHVAPRLPVGTQVSQLVYQAYSGYVLSQFTKLEADLRRDVPKWKHVMHLLRLLLAARTLLRTSEVQVDVGQASVGTETFALALGTRTNRVRVRKWLVRVPSGSEDQDGDPLGGAVGEAAAVPVGVEGLCPAGLVGGASGQDMLAGCRVPGA